MQDDDKNKDVRGVEKGVFQVGKRFVPYYKTPLVPWAGYVSSSDDLNALLESRHFLFFHFLFRRGSSPFYQSIFFFLLSLLFISRIWFVCSGKTFL